MFSHTYTIDFMIFLLILCVTLYLFLTRKFNHWKQKNVPYLPPIPFFGNAFDIFTFRKSMGELSRKIYESTTKPFIGFFICDEPYLLIRNPELVKAVLVKDFASFSNRTIYNNEDDPLESNMLLLMKTPGWRDMRRTVTPAFTSGKMKTMFQHIAECGEEMIQYLREEVQKSPMVDIHEVSARFTTDSIASTSFGINANCFTNESSEFRAVSRRVLNWQIWERAISTSCHFLAPNIVKLFKLKFVDIESRDFLRNVFWKSMQEREEKQFVRNDLIDILIEMKKQECVDNPDKFEGDKLIANALQFFLAGFETTSSTIDFALYELAVNKDVQKKLRAEIEDVISKYGGISYSSLAAMEYLDMIIKETLRKYPPLPFLDRRCSSNYQIPGTDVILEKGSAVFIPIWGLHHDPKYFSDPEKYDPERFTEENVKSRPQFVYLPFGEGPRNCIGARYGIVTSKLGVAKLISEFEIELCEKTQYPLKLIPKGFLLQPSSEVFLKFKKI